MALSLKYREVDQVLQKVLHGTEVHEERWVMQIMGSSFSDLKSHEHISRKNAPKIGTNYAFSHQVENLCD